MKIHERLGIWYEKEKRDLPWRNTSDPYKIWISEIILQQTRVAQGIAYYHRFLEKFPDVFSLAGAETDEVLKIWQGLGYYSRARNLHKTARHIAFERNGIFPGSYSELLSLTGVGEYTAAAISSISYGEPKAAIDGNVKRVISRLFSVTEEINSTEGKKIISKLSDEILDVKNPGRHNQAMMELGANICLPGKPDCLSCPLSIMCLALKENKVAELPLKYKKPKAVDRYFIYLIIRNGDYINIQQRPKGDIWEGLYEFPLIETSEISKENEFSGLIAAFLHTNSFQIEKVSELVIHKLSHQTIKCRFLHIAVSEDLKSLMLRGNIVTISDFYDYPIPRLIDRYISQAGF
jgi:A/G-specific adenine glycosylase